MKITRLIDGRDVDIVLTTEELASAHLEMQIVNYMEFIRANWAVDGIDDATLRGIATDAIISFWDMDIVGETERQVIEEEFASRGIPLEYRED